MLKVLIVEDEELIRKGIVLTVDWAALDCVVVGEPPTARRGWRWQKNATRTSSSPT